MGESPANAQLELFDYPGYRLPVSPGYWLEDGRMQSGPGLPWIRVRVLLGPGCVVWGLALYRLPNHLRGLSCPRN